MSRVIKSINQKKVRVSYWMGFLTSVFISCMIQDWFGLEAYILRLIDGWVDIHWALWLIPISIVISISLYLERDDA